MRNVLDPLFHIPGVRLAVLMSTDGVPIASARGAAPLDEEHGEGGGSLDRDEELNSFTALAGGWMTEIARSVGQLSWDAPRRVVMRATQGTLILHQAPESVVLVALERGASAEELRVPIEGALARMNRVLRTVGQAPPTPPAPLASPPPGLDPGAPAAPAATPETRCSEASGDC